VADRPAQELIDRLAKDFAANVPERDVDGAGAFDAGSPAAHVGEAAEHPVPDALDPARVFALDHLANLPQDGAEGAVGDLRRRGDFAPAGDAFVRRYLDKQIFAPVCAACIDEPRLD